MTACVTALPTRIPRRCRGLSALESLLDLCSLERDLIEDGAKRRTFAPLAVQEGLRKLRAVDDVATLVDRAPRELVESCGFDRAVLFGVHEGRMVMESAYFGDDTPGAEKMVCRLAQDRAGRTKPRRKIFGRGTDPGDGDADAP